MYPLAHVFFAEKALQQQNTEIILGSIFPDVLFFSGCDWICSHSLGQSFWQELNADREMALFCRGVISHSIEPRGLDYYSDQQYRDYEKGYCYEKARPLVEGVIAACDVSPEDGWWKAHNFIEMGVELYLFEKRPRLLNLLHAALGESKAISNICRKIAPLIATKSTGQLEQGYRLFQEFMERGPMDARSLAIRYRDHMFMRHQVTYVNLSQFEDIIEQGREIITADIEIFFDDVTELMLPVWGSIKS